MICSAHFALVRFVGSLYAVTRQVSVASCCFIFVCVVFSCASCFKWFQLFFPCFFVFLSCYRIELSASKNVKESSCC